MNNEIFLCIPCLNTLKAEGKKYKMSRNSREKGTCSRCQRRRFGNYYREETKK